MGSESVIQSLLANANVVSTVVLLIAAYAVIQILRIGHRPSDLPPGPPTLPILGNLHQLPSKNVHIQYRKWSEQYGPIFSLKLGQQTVIVLADGRVIRDLVDARGVNYADRPDLWVRGLFDHSRIIMRGYDSLWRLERKLYHALLNINAAKKYIPYQELETLKLCQDLIDRPEDFVDNIGRMTGSIATSITYGFRLADKDDPETQELLHNSHGFFSCVVQTQYMDWFPALRPVVNLLPTSLYRPARMAVDAYAAERAVFHKYYKIGLNSPLPCFATDIAASQKKWQGTPDGDALTEHAAAYVAGISFEGGADTTRYTLQGLVKAMAMFPEAQRKAQAELDSVVGSKTVPSAEHLPSLPYINATAKETIRWMPTAINGAIPHAAREEDHYRGFRIPKGATIVLSVWSANHNEQDFPDPRRFDPDRQRSDTSLFEATTAEKPADRGQWGFGSGRRQCPGMHVASNTMLLAVARILWAFEIRMAKDEAGREIEIERDAMVGGLAAAPAPFKCKITPRSAERAALVQSEWKRLSSTLLDDKGAYKRPVAA